MCGEMGRAFCNDLKIPVCLLTILFGMGSWIAVSGIFIELPILVTQLPEGWSLPSYLAVVVQIANIGPFSYTIWNILKPGKVYDKKLIFLMVFVGSLTSFLLAFFWTGTSVVGGKDHSTALIVLTFILSLVDCTSSVVFLPFMNTLKFIYMTPFFVGMGFSGLLPSLVALGQGVGQVNCQGMAIFNVTSNATSTSFRTVHQQPNFPVKYFFLFIFAMMITCGIAFTLLNYLPYCKSEHVSTIEKLQVRHGGDIEDAEEEISDLKRPPDQRDETLENSISSSTYLFYLVLVAWINALLNGVLLSAQSYACLPYGAKYYHLSVTLSNIADPFASFLTFFYVLKSKRSISFFSFIGTMISVYVVFLAAGSPAPLLVESTAGGILAVTAYVLVYLTLTLSKISIATRFRICGRRALIWCGAASQLGAAIGSVGMFVLVNVYKVFQQVKQCS